MRERLKGARRWVVKVGSSLLTDEGRGLDHALIGAWAGQLSAFVDDGLDVILVSSGSIAEGIVRLGWLARPVAVHELQAAAAVGQMGLVRAWETGFERHGRLAAQVLLTHDDLADRRRYLNARATLRALLLHRVVPIVNENDTVTTDEIRLGDNDTLAALVANLVGADVLVLLTDQTGLYDRDPRNDPAAVLLERANASDPAIQALAGPSGGLLGRGGMSTKVLAAGRAARSGTTTIIADGREAQVLTRLRAGEALGTMLTSEERPRDARKRWLADQLRTRGTLVLDEGACRTLMQTGSSLLAVGVLAVHGMFTRGELVSCVNERGVEIARGLTNYGADDARRIKGMASDRFATVLDAAGEPELVHRDNLVVLHRPDDSGGPDDRGTASADPTGSAMLP